MKLQPDFVKGKLDSTQILKKHKNLFKILRSLFPNHSDTRDVNMRGALKLKSST